MPSVNIMKLKTLELSLLRKGKQTMMEGFNEVIAKYPELAEKITSAYNTVISDPEERDLEAELSIRGVNISEEDIFKMTEDIVKMMFIPVE